MQVLAHSFLFWAVLIMALLALYILPTLIAVIRGTEGLGWIIVINLLPTGIGWLAALIAAVALPRRSYPDRRQSLPLPSEPTSESTPHSGATRKHATS